MAYQTETEAWNKDTKTIEEVEETMKREGITEDNHFDLLQKIGDVSNRSSFGAKNNPPNKYYNRILCCKKLENKIFNRNKLA